MDICVLYHVLATYAVTSSLDFMENMYIQLRAYYLYRRTIAGTQMHLYVEISLKMSDLKLLRKQFNFSNIDTNSENFNTLTNCFRNRKWFKYYNALSSLYNHQHIQPVLFKTFTTMVWKTFLTLVNKMCIQLCLRPSPAKTFSNASMGFF